MNIISLQTFGKNGDPTNYKDPYAPTPTKWVGVIVGGRGKGEGE